MSAETPDEPNLDAQRRSPLASGQDPTPPSPPSVPRGKATQNGMARVGRMLAGRTTDLLGIAIILIAGLTMGRQVIEWWRTDPTKLTAPLDDSQHSALTWGDNGASVSLEFGDHPCAIVRRMFHGSHVDALSVLRADCRALLDRPDPPQKPIDASERTMLDQLAKFTPDEEEPGTWQLYQIADAFGVVIGTRNFADRGGQRSDATSDHHPPSTIHHPPLPSRRVICWGFAFPFSKDNWVLYTFHSASTSVAVAGLPVPTLPPQSRRVLSLRDERGGSVVSLTGVGQSAEWSRFYDAWFAGQKWRRDADWQQVGNVRQARFRPQGDERAATADLQIVEELSGRLTGLLTITSGDAVVGKNE
ncbi:MAG: hypothetical protein HZA46_01570 [Planctomycetales bacterium]|nr:hypothetical protein [Planctomycetales bacterium]